MPPITTAKAYVASISTGLAAALGAGLPFLDGTAANVVFVILAILGAYGFTYAVPNASATSIARRKPKRDTDTSEGVDGAPPAP